MAEQIQRKNLWEEVERVSTQWTASLGLDYPIIPLEKLRPLWNSAVDQGVGAREALRTIPTAIERRRVDRRAGNVTMHRMK